MPYWITTEAEGRKAVQELAADKVDIVKIWVDTRDGKYKKLTPEIYGAIIDEAHKQGLRVTAHIFDLEDAKGLIRAGVDAFAHGVRDRDIDDELVAMFKQRPNLVLTPNLPDRGVKTDLSWLQGSLPAAELEKLEAANTDRPREQAFYGIQARNLAKLNAAGVRITLGTDGNRPWGAHEEMARHGGRRHDADAGDRGGDAQLGRVPADRRRRHAASGQERRLHRARRQSARRHHQHAADLGGYLRGAAVEAALGALRHGGADGRRSGFGAMRLLVSLPYTNQLSRKGPSSRLSTTRRSILLISSARCASAAFRVETASCHVLQLEPSATMPPTTAVGAPIINMGSNLISPSVWLRSAVLRRQGRPFEIWMIFRQLSMVSASRSIWASRPRISSCRSPSCISAQPLPC